MVGVEGVVIWVLEQGAGSSPDHHWTTGAGLAQDWLDWASDRNHWNHWLAHWDLVRVVTGSVRIQSLHVHDRPNPTYNRALHTPR